MRQSAEPEPMFNYFHQSNIPTTERGFVPYTRVRSPPPTSRVPAYPYPVPPRLAFHYSLYNTGYYPQHQYLELLPTPLPPQNPHSQCREASCPIRKAAYLAYLQYCYEQMPSHMFANNSITPYPMHYPLVNPTPTPESYPNAVFGTVSNMQDASSVYVDEDPVPRPLSPIPFNGERVITTQGQTIYRPTPIWRSASRRRAEPYDLTAPRRNQ
jgi:hypothetical protein